MSTRAPARAALFTTRPPVSFADMRFLMFVIDEMAAALEQRYDDVIRLTLGKSELPPEQAVLDAMLAAAADYPRASRVHPAGLPELRDRLAAEYQARHGTRLPADRFVVSTGTSALFRNLFQLLAGPGDEVVVPLPYYPLYVFSAQLVGATVRYYRVDPVTMRIDFESLAEAVGPGTRIVVVNSPGNPLGNVVSREELLRVDEIVNGRAVLVSDEIYANVVFGPPVRSAVELDGLLRCPVVVTNGFSKGHRMYARRVGYGIVPAELVQPLTVIQHHTLLTADPVSQYGALAALDNPDGPAELATLYQGRRDYTVQSFATVPDVRVLPAQGSFYLTVDCGPFLRRHRIGSSLELAEQILRTTRVATVPGSDFGLPDTLRLSYSAGGYREAIDRLVRFFTAPTPGTHTGTN
ncbi:pyridoxal phosphate-dependent aminotransferase [Actinophytocola sp.]|uniref:pyridoxal phosphate-dependent aminotransferase n=1 Tax=Actinophytocola sp. TaxID=1872138 RepID=UPI00389A09D6